eukprot:2173884-Prymnesium_polylepis.1
MAAQQPPLEPDGYSFAAAISACDRGRSPQLALDLLQRMQAHRARTRAPRPRARGSAPPPLRRRRCHVSRHVSRPSHRRRCAATAAAAVPSRNR